MLKAKEVKKTVKVASVYTVPSSNWMSYSLSSVRTDVTLDLKNKAVPVKEEMLTV